MTTALYILMLAALWDMKSNDVLLHNSIATIAITGTNNDNNDCIGLLRIY
ncbi:MAG: hypothetical protein Q4A56_08675 [Porphyromonadaceae bacterium]|nr:hypothetical protein [Porphyromonadaceae bacterium]